MFKANIQNGLLTSRFDEIKTHLNHQLSFSPHSNQGHVLVDGQHYDFEVDNDGHLYSPAKLDGYDYYDGKSYLGHYNELQFSPNNAGKKKKTKSFFESPLYKKLLQNAIKENDQDEIVRLLLLKTNYNKSKKFSPEMTHRGYDATEEGMKADKEEADKKKDDAITTYNNYKTNQINEYLRYETRKQMSPNIQNGLLTSRFDEIKTHLNHQLSFSPHSNQGHVLVDGQHYDFEVDNDGHLYSPAKLDGYDYYDGKSYLGHYNELQFSPLAREEQNKVNKIKKMENKRMKEETRPPPDEKQKFRKQFPKGPAGDRAFKRDLKKYQEERQKEREENYHRRNRGRKAYQIAHEHPELVKTLFYSGL